MELSPGFGFVFFEEVNAMIVIVIVAASKIASAIARPRFSCLFLWFLIIRYLLSACMAIIRVAHIIDTKKSPLYSEKENFYIFKALFGRQYRKK